MQRNPFRVQTSEQAANQEEFLSLFGSDVLEVLPKDGLWNRLLILEAASGAGKSTILRLFTPEVLKEVHRNRARPENLGLIDRLEDFDAMSARGPLVLGTLVSCRGQYAAIDDLELSDVEKRRWFFGLLDARVALLTLRSVCTFAGLQYPNDLARLTIPPLGSSTDTARSSLNGLELYDEAAAREDSLATAIDSLTSHEVSEDSLRTQLNVLRSFSGPQIEIPGVYIPEICLTMFDDVQDLTPWQQGDLVKDLQNRDIRTARWIARRLDVLSIDELLQSGGTDGRDYQRRRMEDWARVNRAKFRGLLETIADRRIRKTDLGVNSFASLLDSELTTQSEILGATAASEKAREDLLAAHGDEVAYSSWIEVTEADCGDRPDTHLESAKHWRALDIITNRRRPKREARLSHEPRSPDELYRQKTSDVLTAAELLVALDHRLPFYYGFSRISGLASSNIEQFLRIGGAIFDKLLLLQVTGRRSNISATEQDQIARRLAIAAIEAIPRDVPFGSEVQRLVQSIGTYSREITTREAASYSPGVLGVGLRQSQFQLLLDDRVIEQRAELGRLRDVLRSSIAHNVLEARGPKKVKGHFWMVFYLNRLLSPAFRLPVVSSQFQEIAMSDMLTWLTYGYRQPSRQERLSL